MNNAGDVMQENIIDVAMRLRCSWFEITRASFISNQNSSVQPRVSFWRSTLVLDVFLSDDESMET
jgi:hypothetical protein